MSSVLLKDLTPRLFEEKLVAEFPNLYREMWFDPKISCMAFGVCVDSGWYQLIYDLSIKLEALILELPQEDREKSFAAQVKQKFGSLRFYLDGATKEMSSLINEAEEKSKTICEKCSAPGEYVSAHGYIETICKDCKKKSRL